MKLRVGKIPYLNLMPIFYMLTQECDCSEYEFVEGYPAKLNEMLRTGSLDVSPSSSVEYLRRESDYDVMDGHSISSRGPVESILLFSRLPLSELDGRKVFVTYQSETSAALLEVILRKFYNINCALKVSSLPSEEALKSHSAFLAIGDDALSAARMAKNITEECPETGCSFLRFGIFQYFVYDLGEIWEKSTGLPFVYALWISRKDLPDEKKYLIKKFAADLDHAKSAALKKLPELSRLAGHAMPPEDIVRYWDKISYNLGEEHRKGLALFRGYLEELGLLKSS
jgi:chorismate dehydratase